MKTTVDLPGELVRRVKIRAVMQNRRVKDTVAELLRLGLAASEKAEDVPPPRKGNISLPLFQCAPGAPASRMTTEDVLALTIDSQQGEDLERLPL